MFSKQNFKFCFILFFVIILIMAGCSGITPTSPIINSFTADSITITEGESTTLSWQVTDATSISISPTVGDVSGTPTGNHTVSPTETTTYTLFANNSAGSTTAIVIITMNPALVEYNLTATSGEGGQINPEGVITVNEGGSQIFTITPDGCHIINEVLVDGLSMGTIDTYTFTDVQQDHTLSASFVFPSRRVYNADTGIEYEIIQHAIDAALDGQTIVVCPGTYMENIEFDSRNLTLRSSDPLDPAIVNSTIIDGKDNASVVRLVNDTSTIIGFTIQNGNASHGGGIYVDEGSPIIEKNNIINNNATMYGGGIYIYKSSPTIIGNTIIGNKASTNGGGIYVDSASFPIIGGINAVDTVDFNTVCSNNPNQVEPDVYPYNNIYPICMFDMEF